MQRAKLEQLELQCLGLNLRLSLPSRSIHQRNISGGWPKHELKRQRQRLKKPSCGGGLRLEDWIFNYVLSWFATFNGWKCIKMYQPIRDQKFTTKAPSLSICRRPTPRSCNCKWPKRNACRQWTFSCESPPFPATFHTRTCFSVSRLTMLERMWPNPQGFRLAWSWMGRLPMNVCEITTSGTNNRIDTISTAMMEWNLDEWGSAGLLWAFDDSLVCSCVPSVLPSCWAYCKNQLLGCHRKPQVIAELQDRLNTEAGRILEKSVLKVVSPSKNLWSLSKVPSGPGEQTCWNFIVSGLSFGESVPSRCCVLELHAFHVLYDGSVVYNFAFETIGFEEEDLECHSRKSFHPMCKLQGGCHNWANSIWNFHLLWLYSCRKPMFLAIRGAFPEQP